MRHVAVLAALCASLAGCAGARITTEFNPKLDYKTFRTYAWNPAMPGTEQAASIRNPAVYALVRDAVERELANKGLQRVDTGSPDLLVSVHGMGKDRIEVQSYGYAYGGYGYYGGPFGYPAPVAMGASVQTYRDGTLIVDLIDARTKELAWRGTASDTVSDPSQVQGVVNNAVHTLMQEYPPRTGGK
jgi:hypothetical protein